jgi:glucose/arabinose dehydrogenase
MLMRITATLLILLAAGRLQAETLGDYWGTAEAEAEYYKIVEIPIPETMAMEAGSFEVMPDDRLAIGTRRGDIFLASGVFDKNPLPSYQRYASGLDELMGMSYKDGAFYVTQQTEVTRITDTNDDGRADRFETLSDVWGFRNYHEFAFGSKLDPEGNIWVALCLSKSYHSDAPFRGWCLKITPDGKTIPICSGIRSPCGIGPNEHGVMFYAESQGPWNGSCSLKVLQPGGFMGHPISFNWYDLAPNMGEKPVEPNTRSRLLTERQRVKQLVPYAVVFPYIKMGRSISGFMVDRTGGKFGPFQNQIFIGDFSLSVVMRATTEQVNGVWQGACYPFREGLATGLLAVQFTPRGDLIVGGTNRGWPVRGPRQFAIQRLDWTGKVPFEIKEINARPDGFLLTFTKPVDREVASQGDTYALQTYTHIYQQGYGSPEVDHTTPRVTKASVSADGLQVQLQVEGLVQGHIHDFALRPMRSAANEPLLHEKAYYTLNEIPRPSP